MVNVEGIDFPHISHADANSCGYSPDSGFSFETSFGIEALGIIDAGDFRVRRKHNGGCNDGTGERTYTNFIDARDRSDTRFPEQPFEVQHILDTQSFRPFLFIALFESIVNFSNTLARISSELVQRMGCNRLIPV